MQTILSLDLDDFSAFVFLMSGNITETISEQCFNISITNDNRREDTEMFIVQFEVTNSQGSFMYDPINSTIYIEDDDGKCISMLENTAECVYN